MPKSKSRKPPLRELIRERTLKEDGPGYRLRNGQVHFNSWELGGADVKTFRFYLGSFAKDRHSCFCASTRLRNSDPASFHALNYTFHGDDNYVWTLGGEAEGADPRTFEVCDDGCRARQGNLYPYGYGKDETWVYYYDFQGKTKRLRQADPASFCSLGEGQFGVDDKNVFWGTKPLPKVRPAHWKLLGHEYSIDGPRVYYFNRLLEGADPDTFEVVPVGDTYTDDHTNRARDKRRFYWNDKPISKREWLKLAE